MQTFVNQWNTILHNSSKAEGLIQSLQDLNLVGKVEPKHKHSNTGKELTKTIMST